MSTETPLTDADVARLVALADAAHKEHDSESEFPWVDLIDGLDDGDVIGLCECDEAYLKAVSPATIKALAARLDSLQAENTELRKATRFGSGRVERLARQALHAENQRLEKQATKLADGVWTWREQCEKAEAERDALRDAITALADQWEDINHPARRHAHILRELLSEVGGTE